MRASTFLSAFVVVVLLVPGLRAADPVTVELLGEVAVPTAVVTVGDVAKTSGGDARTRERIARLDLADVKPHEQGLTISRRVVEYRLRLANLDGSGVLVTGADRTTVTVARRLITADEVVAATRADLFRKVSVPPETVTIELAQPVVVQLPQVPAGDVVTITAVPRARNVAYGRVQMDVVISAGGEHLLSLVVYLEVKPINRPLDPITPVAGVSPSAMSQANRSVLPADRSMRAKPGEMRATPATLGEVLVRPRQQVTMVVRSGTLNVTALGESQQEGRLGQTIQVQNVDSKKMISARVSGLGTVEVELEPQQP